MENTAESLPMMQYSNEWTCPKCSCENLTASGDSEETFIRLICVACNFTDRMKPRETGDRPMPKIYR